MTQAPPPIWHRRWFQYLLGALLLLVVASLVLPWLLGLVYALRPVLLPVVVALGLAYVINPVVTWGHRRLKLPRWAGTSAVMLAAVFIVGMVLLIVLPPLISQGVDLLHKAKQYPKQISQLIETNADGDAGPDQAGEDPQPQPVTEEATKPITENGPVEQTAGDTQAADADDSPQATSSLPDVRLILEQALDPERAKELLASAANWLSKLDWAQVAGFVLTSLDVGVGVVGSAINITSYIALSAVIIGFCFFFFSWKLDSLIGWFVPFIPSSHRQEVLAVLVRMDRSVSAFIRGRLIQAAVMAVVLSIGWWMADVRYWLLLGVLSGVLNLVPFAAVFGFLAALILAVVDHVAGGGFTVWVLIWPTVVYMAAQLLDGWVVEPIVQGKATDLDPVSVLLAVMVGGALAGLLGMLIAIPAAACLKILARDMLLPRLRALAAGVDAGKTETPTA